MALNPWHAFEDIPGQVALDHAWLSRIGDNYPFFKSLFLKPSSALATVFPCPRRCGCTHSIIHRHDKTAVLAVCRCNPPRCPDIPLTVDQITGFELDWPKLARVLSRTFGLNTKFLPLSPKNTAQFGSWSADGIPAIITIQVFPSNFRQAVAELAAKLRQPFLLFAPTSDHVDAVCREILATCGAAFFPLDANTALTAKGALEPRVPPSQLFAAFGPQPVKPNPAPQPRYALRKGLGMWKLIFDGQEAYLKHERGIFYVAWLLYNPPEQPIHAIDLMAKIPEIYRQQLGLAPLVDPTTGKSVNLESHARIQERSLALDDAQAMRAIYRKEKELEAILDSEDATEPEKAEALRELEELAEFQRQHTRRSQDSARNAVDAVRKAIRRLHRNLVREVDPKGNPHPVLCPFALHLQNHLLIPSARYIGPGSPPSKKGPAGCLTYEPPPTVSWAA